MGESRDAKVRCVCVRLKCFYKYIFCMSQQEETFFDMMITVFIEKCQYLSRLQHVRRDSKHIIGSRGP